MGRPLTKGRVCQFLVVLTLPAVTVKKNLFTIIIIYMTWIYIMCKASCQSGLRKADYALCF